VSKQKDKTIKELYNEMNKLLNIQQNKIRQEFNIHAAKIEKEFIKFLAEEKNIYENDSWDFIFWDSENQQQYYLNDLKQDQELINEFVLWLKENKGN